MGHPKNPKFFLSAEETLEFKRKLKETTSQREFANVLCTTEATICQAIKNNKVLKFWKEHLELREKNKELTEKLKRFVSNFKELSNE